MAIDLRKSKETVLRIDSKTVIITDKPVNNHKKIISKYKKAISELNNKSINYLFEYTGSEHIIDTPNKSKLICY